MNERPADSLAPEYFDARYAEKLDYWGFETSDYEAAKYADTLAALPARSYRHAFEIGCSIGVLTAKLAARCERLLSVDVAEQALAAASSRCAGMPHVRFEKMRFPRETPGKTERFDLIVVSEVGYYWSRDELAVAQAEIESRLEPGGILLLVHWTPEVGDYPLTGDEVHESFLRRPNLQQLHGHRANKYRLDVLQTG